MARGVLWRGVCQDNGRSRQSRRPHTGTWRPASAHYRALERRCDSHGAGGLTDEPLELQPFPTGPQERTREALLRLQPNHRPQVRGGSCPSSRRPRKRCHAHGETTVTEKHARRCLFAPLARGCGRHGRRCGSHSLGGPPSHSRPGVPRVCLALRCSHAALHKAATTRGGS